MSLLAFHKLRLHVIQNLSSLCFAIVISPLTITLHCHKQILYLTATTGFKKGVLKIYCLVLSLAFKTNTGATRNNNNNNNNRKGPHCCFNVFFRVKLMSLLTYTQPSDEQTMKTVLKLYGCTSKKQQLMQCSS